MTVNGGSYVESLSLDWPVMICADVRYWQCLENRQALLCFVSLWVDLPTFGMVWDARNLIGMANDIFPCMYFTALPLLKYFHCCLWESASLIYGPIISVHHRTVGHNTWF